MGPVWQAEWQNVGGQRMDAYKCEETETNCFLTPIQQSPEVRDCLEDKERREWTMERVKSRWDETSGAERRQEANVEQGGKKEKAEDGVLWRISKLRVS